MKTQTIEKSQETDVYTLLCGVCKEEQPKWKVHNELKDVKICRDCVNHIRAMAKANKRDYHEELNIQIDYVLNAT